jgi:hypothetical protein
MSHFATATLNWCHSSVADPLTMKVWGVDGLRVCDATNGHIFAPVMMMAEKAADLILGNTPLPPEPTGQGEYGDVRMDRSRSSMWSHAAIALGVVGCAPAVWWLSSLASSNEAAGIEDPDYMIRPSGVSDGTLAAIGLAGIAAVSIGILTYRRAMKSGPVSELWRMVYGPFVAISGLLGLFYAVATTPVIGANIGGGMLALGLMVVTPAMLVIAAVGVRRLSAAHRL